LRPPRRREYSRETWQPGKRLENACSVMKGGVTVEVSVIGLEHETQWSLEVVNSAGTSIVWDDLFASGEKAFAEFERRGKDANVPRRRHRNPFPPVNGASQLSKFSRARRYVAESVVCEDTFLDYDERTPTSRVR
jgi:hypothetical protein